MKGDLLNPRLSKSVTYKTYKIKMLHLVVKKKLDLCRIGSMENWDLSKTGNYVELRSMINWD